MKIRMRLTLLYISVTLAIVLIFSLGAYWVPDDGDWDAGRLSVSRSPIPSPQAEHSDGAVETGARKDSMIIHISEKVRIQKFNKE